ncbi:hypothetical protein P7H55_00355 [Vagococcus lutrae]|uniref:hypothetical protein n=1 Tax=Vagococcus lutrae TaxID=81947 RepID=UPI002891EBCD|nr:hypothetical protein [Vagococcus lutrae]MDT2816307.1 hypothetical protein [Vagococcus lutrae]
MVNKVISKPLTEALKRKRVQSKEMAISAKIPQSTFSSYAASGNPTPIEKAQKFTETLQDSKFTLEMAYIFFGTVSAMTGDRYQNNPLALDILQQKESNERKFKKDRALEVLTLNDGTLSMQDKDIILDYSLEYLDEIMVETTMLVSLLDLCDISINKAVEKRMDYWIARGYMREER